MVTLIDGKALDELGRVLDRKVGGDFNAQHPYLNFLDTLLGLDENEYRASEFPNGFFDRIIDRINEEPAVLAAIRAWDAEGNLIEATPAIDGILRTAATEALRMANALNEARFPEKKGEQE